MDHLAPYSPSARGRHAEATYAPVRLVRRILPLSPGRKRSDSSDDCHLSVVFWRLSGFCHEAGRSNGATAALYRGHVSELSVRSRKRELKTGTIRLRVATLGSFGKWMVRRDKVVRNPVDRLTRPRRKARVPAVPAWPAAEALLGSCTLRERAMLALMAFGGLRRGEVVALDVGDVVFDFGLRRVMGKGGHEVPVALPARARAILRDYVAAERAGAPTEAPLFVVTYMNKAGLSMERRITGQRIWKIVRGVGKRASLPALHPHALRHACGAELLRQTKNLRLVQEQLRHADVQTTTGYTRITQQDIREGLETLGSEGE